MSGHPLYPEQDEDEGIELISLYEDKPCMICKQVKKDLEWKYITHSSGIYIDPGYKFKVELMRVCKRCHALYMTVG